MGYLTRLTCAIVPNYLIPEYQYNDPVPSSDDQATTRSSDSDLFCRVNQVGIHRLRYRKGDSDASWNRQSASHQNPGSDIVRSCDIAIVPPMWDNIGKDRPVDENNVIANSTLVHLYESSSVFSLSRDPAKTKFGGSIPPHLSHFTPNIWRRIQILCRTMKVKSLDRSFFHRTLRPPWGS
jgi:hypothetical protein